MTFPQTDSSRAVTLSQEYWRLKTLAGSAGDMYESVEGAKAFVIGPDSDFGAYRIAYFDEMEVSRVSQFRVSPDRSFIGRLDARNRQPYPGMGGRKGRILISLDDIVDFSFRPSAFNAGSDSIRFERPQIDILQYFVDPPSLVPQRSDRIFRYQYLSIPSAPGDSSWIIVPAFGRKSGYFTFTNLDQATVITATVTGIKMSISADPGPVGTYEEQLFSAAINPNASDNYPWLSSADGAWDLFAIELDGYIGEAMPMTVTLSDDVI